VILLLSEWWVHCLDEEEEESEEEGEGEEEKYI